MCEVHKTKKGRRREEEANLQSPKHLLFLAQITGHAAYLCTGQGPMEKHGLRNDSSEMVNKILFSYRKIHVHILDYGLESMYPTA